MDRNILCFGLLQSSMSALEDGFGVSFHFIHKTFQEYLAALFLVNILPDISPDTQLNDTESSSSDITLNEIQMHALSSRFDIIWKFVFGIHFNTNVNKCHDCNVIKPYLSNFDSDETLALSHCAFEAKSEVVDQEIIKYVSHEKIVQFYARSAYDCNALTYIISKIQESKECTIYLYKCGAAIEHQVRKLTNVLASKDGKIQVREMNLKGNQLNDRCILNLFNGAKCAFPSIKRLYLNSNEIGTENGIQFINQKPFFGDLTLLDLSDNPLEVSGFLSLETAIDSDSLTNLRKLFLKNTLTSDAERNATVLHTFVKALSLHCPNLKKLNLSQNNLGLPGAKALANIMSEHNKDPTTAKQGWLSEFVINETKLGDEGLCAFIDTLKTFFIFNILYLRGNDIRALGMQYLINAIFTGKIILKEVHHRVELWLDDNPLGLEGANCIGQLLSNPQIICHAIGLFRCQLTTSGSSNSNTNEDTGNQLCELPQNKYIHSLYLDGNNFSGDGIHILAGFIYMCPALQNLRSGNSAILSDDFKLLLSEIKQLKLRYPNICGQLHAWRLDNNEIDDDGLIVLQETQPWLLFPQMKCAMKRNPSIMKNLVLSNNRISAEAITVLNEEWKKQMKVSVPINVHMHGLPCTNLSQIL